jgi:hypothetical protein
LFVCVDVLLPPGLDFSTLKLTGPQFGVPSAPAAGTTTLRPEIAQKFTNAQMLCNSKLQTGQTQPAGAGNDKTKTNMKNKFIQHYK